MNLNHYDILIIGIYVGYILSAILTLMLIKVYRLKGLLLGILFNAVVHTSLLVSNEILSHMRIPTAYEILVAVCGFLLVTLVMVAGTYIVMRLKKRQPELASAYMLFLTSVFIWDFFLPALFALIILVLPEKAMDNDSRVPSETP